VRRTLNKEGVNKFHCWTLSAVWGIYSPWRRIQQVLPNR